MDKFNDEFIIKFRGENDPDKILYFEDVIDNPHELNKQMAAIPSLYAYWASVKRDAKQLEVKRSNTVAMMESNRVRKAVDSLKEKGSKTPTTLAIHNEIKVLFKKDVKYQKALQKEKEANEITEKVGVIERAVLSKQECLRTIAQLTNGMMNTGLYVMKGKPKKRRGPDA